MSIPLKYKNLIDFLDFRIEAIENSKNILDNSTIEKKENRKKYYLDVAYFIHAIYENYDLRLLFEELLSYQIHLQEKKSYIAAVGTVKTSIRRIATKILSHPKFNEFEKRQNGGDWINPFEILPFFKLKQLLLRLKTEKVKPFRIPFDQVYTLYINHDGLNGILNRFFKVTEDKFENILKELDIFRENLRILFFHEQFQYDYLGIGSAVQLQLIYRNLHPLFDPREINESFYKSILNKGEDISDADKLLGYCKRIRDYFKQKLNTNSSIEIAIIRFKHFMEIFYNGIQENPSEKSFAIEFELFMFNNGYLALSEGQIGNARYDNIILDANNAFLCEHKQIGFSKGNERRTAEINKFRSAQIQSQIYHDRLILLPNLSNNVYIIVFTKFNMKFYNNIDVVQKDGINFKFVLISLDKTPPSKLKPFEINILDLVK